MIQSAKDGKPRDRRRAGPNPGRVRPAGAKVRQDTHTATGGRELTHNAQRGPGETTRRHPPREALEALLTGRDPVVETVRAHLALPPDTPGHLLLVGPPGSGKTHCVDLALARLDDAPTPHPLAVARLPGNPRTITSLTDLAMQILTALAPSAPEARAVAHRIGATWAREPAKAQRVALTALHHRTRDHILVVVCEGLATLCTLLGAEDVAAWRRHMEKYGPWRLLATDTPRGAATVTAADGPFPDFFTQRALEPLTCEGTLELLEKASTQAGKTTLARDLATPTGRAGARVIHHLGAGNHRVCLTAVRFLDDAPLDRLEGPVTQMLDHESVHRLSPLRTRAPAQRKIVDALVTERRPATVAHIARHALQSPRTCSHQMRLLAADGVVQTHRVGRTTRCEIADPLTRLCCESARNVHVHLRRLVAFLQDWYLDLEGAERPDTFAPPPALAPESLKRLTTAQTLGAEIGPLGATLESLQPVVDDPAFDADEPAHLASLILIATLWVQRHGPQDLPDAVHALRKLGPKTAAPRPLARGLTVFILQSLRLAAMQPRLPGTVRWRGTAAQWNDAIAALETGPARSDACRIPLDVLAAAARWMTTGNDTALLDLPLELRTLLEDRLQTTRPGRTREPRTPREHRSPR